MRLSDYSIRNPTFAWMLMLAMIIFGLSGFFGMGVSQLPDVDAPFVTVQINYDGASPQVMEVDVVDVVEEAVMTVEGIRDITSTSQDARATVSIEFDLERDIDAAVQEVQAKLHEAQRRLPQGMDTPVISKSNPEDHPIMWVSLSGDLPVRDLMTYARDHLKDSFETVSGVSEITMGGYIEPNLRIWVDPARLDKYDLTDGDIINAIGREHVEIPAGTVEGPEKEYTLRYMGEALSTEAFADILIKTRVNGGAVFKPIRLGDVVRVESGLDDVRRISRTNLKPAIGLGIKKQRGTNAVRVADGVKRRLDELQKDLPRGTSLQVNYDSTKFIKQSTHELNFTLLLSALLTSVVCLVFLGTLRASINILLAIPTSIIGTFFVLHICGFTLNTFTLLGLILAIGIVVDDAIMILENIIRHQEMGKSLIRAALDGAREISSAAVAATIAIVAIFVPVLFVPGAIGRFLFQFGVTISVAVILSLIEALTLTPMRASLFVSVSKNRDAGYSAFVGRTFDRVSVGYKRILAYCLKHRVGVVTAAVIIFALSLFVVPQLRKEMVPAQDQGSFLVNLETPIGSSIEFTNSRVKQAEKIIMTYPELVRYYTAIGGFGGGQVNAAVFFVTLKNYRDRPVDLSLGHRRSQFEIMQQVRQDFSSIRDLKIFVQDLSLRGIGSNRRGFPIEFSIRGPDWNRLTEVAEKVKGAMTKSPTFVDVDSNYKFGIPEIQIIPDHKKALEYGLSLDEIGTTINALVAGIRYGKFNENGRRNDIRIRLAPEFLDADHILKGLTVRNTKGELIPLDKVVTLKHRLTLQSITRENRERAVSLSANLTPNQSTDLALAELNDMAKDLLPEGYRMVMTGAARTFSESQGDLLLVFLMGILVAYMILASQYNSLVHPVIVLMALPFSITGAFAALLLFDQSLNLYSMIGLVLLMGIVKKNSILLVDFTNQRRSEGLKVHEALLTACPQRLRPIIMTSFSTIAAAVPPALGLGAGSETIVPMAIVILGGVFVATLLTLFVVPCAYLIFSRLERMPLDYAKKIIDSMSG
ncbi:MAG: efflux RND transporter permease subunit, partial [Deltaproteobacteria bacterium]|nr:efflux RND transporter permease subunit [Deltaproteobacteria bacterium]